MFLGKRVIIPTCQHARLLEELHYSHIGVVQMKNAAHPLFWWPGLNQDIEAIAARCEGCRRHRKRPPKGPLCPWPYARRPMEWVHIDFAEYKNRMILVMVDAYSKKNWCALMNQDTTTLKNLAVLYGWFC